MPHTTSSARRQATLWDNYPRTSPNFWQYDVTRNYHRGEQHSVAAHASLDKAEQLKRVLRAISRGQQAICEDIEIRLNLPHQSVSARFSDLKRLGLIEKYGTGKTTSGRSAGMYRLSALGSEVLAGQTSVDSLRKP